MVKYMLRANQFVSYQKTQILLEKETSGLLDIRIIDDLSCAITTSNNAEMNNANNMYNNNHQGNNNKMQLANTVVLLQQRK